MKMKFSHQSRTHTRWYHIFFTFQSQRAGEWERERKRKILIQKFVDSQTENSFYVEHPTNTNRYYWNIDFPIILNLSSRTFDWMNRTYIYTTQKTRARLNIDRMSIGIAYPIMACGYKIKLCVHFTCFQIHL